MNAAIAVPAWHLRRPVRIVLDRDEDMHIMGQRHAFLGRYKACRPIIVPLDVLSTFAARVASCGLEMCSSAARHVMRADASSLASPSSHRRGLSR